MIVIIPSYGLQDIYSTTKLISVNDNILKVFKTFLI